MLVLSRKINESILIGENVHITILETRKGNVRIGIDAPRDIQISRPDKTPKTIPQEVSSQENPRESKQHSLAFCGSIS